ncbi:MAG TPA: hypothetical protein VNL38_03165 [Candidatus Nitrosotenuis sp.]|nr:hypothetical protein [Candidatus Nitrosotenuis sp.]
MTRAASAAPTWIPLSRAGKLLGKSHDMVRIYALDMGLLRYRRVGERGWIQVALEDVMHLMATSTAVNTR